MRLHKVKFEGSDVLMPFLSKEDCASSSQSLIACLKSLKDTQEGLCEAVYKAEPQSISLRVRLANLMLYNFTGTMPRVQNVVPEQCYHAYLPAYVRGQLGIPPNYGQKDAPGTYNHRVREFWIKHQISLLEQTP